MSDFVILPHMQEVEAAALSDLRGSIPLSSIKYVPMGPWGVQVYVFYHRDEDVVRCEESGISRTVQEVFEREIRARWLRAEVSIRFEFDSHENVENNYEGSYFFRLR